MSPPTKDAATASALLLPSSSETLSNRTVNSAMPISKEAKHGHHVVVATLPINNTAPSDTEDSNARYSSDENDDDSDTKAAENRVDGQHPKVDTWTQMLQHLQKFRMEYGNSLVTQQHTENLQLANWVDKQRVLEGALVPERKAELDSIGFTWRTQQEELEMWEGMFARFVEYKKRHGTCLIPRYYKGDIKLINWVCTQSSLKKRGILSTTRVNILDSVGFVWSTTRTVCASWDIMFERLVEFKTEFGHCQVDQQDRYTKVEPDLITWVHDQRINKEGLPLEQFIQLRSIGFEWPSPVSKDSWDIMFDHLASYKQVKGDCLVPQRYATNPKLGRWVNKQRENNDRLTPRRRSKLASIGFIWSVIQREPWNAMYQRLVDYKVKYGDCLVPQRFKRDPRLGGWVREQRKKRQYISSDRMRRLNAIGFAWRAKENPVEYQALNSMAMQVLQNQHACDQRLAASNNVVGWQHPTGMAQITTMTPSGIPYPNYRDEQMMGSAQVPFQQHHWQSMADTFAYGRQLRVQQMEDERIASIIMRKRAIREKILQDEALSWQQQAPQQAVRPVELRVPVAPSLNASMPILGISPSRVGSMGDSEDSPQVLPPTIPQRIPQHVESMNTGNLHPNLHC